MLQSLGHPIRLQILAALRERPMPVSDIVGRLHLAQPVVSRHLSILRRGGIVGCTPSGRERVYRIADCDAKALLEVLFISSDTHSPTPNSLNHSSADPQGAAA